MKLNLQFLNSGNTYRSNIITKTLPVIITVAIIVWALPRHESNRIHYDVGKPWMYGSFIAKFDFPIYKTEEAIKAEVDSTEKIFQPYYTYNKNVETEAINRFYKEFGEDEHKLPTSVQNIIKDRLHRLYQAGIMNTPDYNNLSKDSTKIVRVVDGKEAQSIQINCIFSTLTAYEHLLADEHLAPMRQTLQKLNLNEYIDPNLSFDKERSSTELNDMISGISSASGMVLSGQKVIDRGEIVNEYDYRVLSSYEREMQRRSTTEAEITSTLIGQIMFVSILVLIFTIYLSLFRRDYFDKPRNILMLYTLITVFPVAVSLMVTHTFFNVYMMPFAMVPIFTRIFMDSRTAFITHTVMVLICAAAVKYQYEFIIVQLVAGLAAIYSLREMSKRAQIFKAVLLITIAGCFINFALQMMQENDMSKIDYSIFFYLFLNGILLLVTYPMMYGVERIFGFVSDVTLYELSNTSSGLLRQLSEAAPGTYQHSTMVGNLAAQIANRIGANSLLVRTGALYHDIGKMQSPVFFTENQTGVNPHDNIPYKKSAQIIIGHVSEGVKLAEKAGLSTIIKDFILTHHGRGVTKYFYIKYKNEHPDEDVSTEPFTYPGPNPFTREQAILMMADTVEAASRALPEYTEESINTLVNKLVDAQVSEGLFRECPITFRDISQAKMVLIERLMSIYHTRIQYPELKKEE